MRESREDRRKRRQMEKKVSKTLDQICKDMTNSFFVDADTAAEGAASRLAAMSNSASTSSGGGAENYSSKLDRRYEWK